MLIKVIVAVLIISQTLSQSNIAPSGAIVEPQTKSGLMPGGFTGAQTISKTDPVFIFVREQILNQNKDNSNLKVTPVAIYSQVVQGSNYKVIAGISDSKKITVNLAVANVFQTVGDSKLQLTGLQTLPTETK